MKLTEFTKLRTAVSNLDIHLIRNLIAELREQLEGDGQPLDPKNVVITEEAIYYIEPTQGIATKVALYEPEQSIGLDDFPLSDVGSNGYEDPEVYREFNTYHLLRCNILSHAKSQKWAGKNFRAVQRKDNVFPFRLVIPSALTGGTTDYHQDIEKQRLNICSNCLIKINSLLDETEFTEEDFHIRSFFDAGYAARWKKHVDYSRNRGSLADIYPKDWDEISRVRMAQAKYICESCSTDFSKRELRRFLTIHHTDHLSDQVSFVRLQCLCLGCRAEEFDGDKIRASADYKHYLSEVEGETTIVETDHSKDFSRDVPDWQKIFIQAQEDDEN